jgi:hypothetical protein
MLSLKVFLHPKHLLDQEVMVRLVLIRLAVWPNEGVPGRLSRVSLLLTSSLLQILDLLKILGLFASQKGHMDPFTLILDDEFFQGQFRFVIAFKVSFSLKFLL